MWPQSLIWLLSFKKITPSAIIDKVVTLWIGGRFGAPMKFIADNGGEFANDEYGDVCQNLNIEVCNTTSYCLTKISIRAKRSISRVFSLFIVPSPFFCTLPVQRPY